MAKNPTIKKQSSAKKVVYWIIAILLFYVLTTATVSTETAEVVKNVEQRYTVQEPYVVEKVVTSTKYETKKVPYGEPRCEQMNYNFTYLKSYSETTSGLTKTGDCVFTVTNAEDIAGNFSFHIQFFKNGAVSEAPDQTKNIDAFGTAVFESKLSVGVADSLDCQIQSNGPPKRMKCFYLEPITYQIKQVPYTVNELKNVTEYKTVEKSKMTTAKVNETRDVYTNNFFGYKQFFYFGY